MFGDIECLEQLLSSAEMVLDSKDLVRRSYYERIEMLNKVRNNLKRYEERVCGKFMDSIDKDTRGKFKAAEALLELSFKERGEHIDYKFSDKELGFVKAVTRFDYFDLLTKDDILRRIFNYEFIELMRSYILGSSEYIEERLKDSDIDFYLRAYFKGYWDRMKGKINEAINEANRHDWFLMLLRGWDNERSIDTRLEDLNKASRIEDLESIKRDILNTLDSIKHDIESRISRELQEGVKGILVKELESINRRKEELEDMIRRREEEIALREEEIAKREEELAKREEEVKKVLKGELKGHLVRADEAAILELIFINKLRSKLSETPIVIKAPWGEVTINRWSYERILPEGAEQNATIPRNMSIVVGHISRTYLGLREVRVIEVRGIYLSHIETLKEHGFDHTPATLDDLLNTLRSNLDANEGNRKYMVIGVASPTGWDESVARYVTGEYSLVFSNAVVILVDLIDNKAIYPMNLSTTMPYIDRYARMFIPEVGVEEERYVEEVIDYLCDEARAKSPDNPVFPYKELVERVKVKVRGLPELVVIRVISRYREKGLIEINNINGERVVLCKSMG